MILTVQGRVVTVEDVVSFKHGNRTNQYRNLVLEVDGDYLSVTAWNNKMSLIEDLLVDVQVQALIEVVSNRNNNDTTLWYHKVTLQKLL